MIQVHTLDCEHSAIRLIQDLACRFDILSRLNITATPVQVIQSVKNYNMGISIPFQRDTIIAIVFPAVAFAIIKPGKISIIIRIIRNLLDFACIVKKNHSIWSAIAPVGSTEIFEIQVQSPPVIRFRPFTETLVTTCKLENIVLDLCHKRLIR